MEPDDSTSDSKNRKSRGDRSRGGRQGSKKKLAEADQGDLQAAPPSRMGFVTCPRGGEPWMVRLLGRLGATARIRSEGVVQFRADPLALARFGRYGRGFLRWSLRLAKGEKKAVLKQVANVEWKTILPAGIEIDVPSGSLSAEDLAHALTAAGVQTQVSSVDRGSPSITLIGEKKGKVSLQVVWPETIENADPIAALAAQSGLSKSAASIDRSDSPSLQIIYSDGEVARSLAIVATLIAAPRAYPAPWDLLCGLDRDRSLPESPEQSSEPEVLVQIVEADREVRAELERRGAEIGLGGQFSCVSEEQVQSNGELSPARATVFSVLTSQQRSTPWRDSARLAERFRRHRLSRHIALAEESLDSILGRPAQRSKSLSDASTTTVVAQYDLVEEAPELDRNRDLPPDVEEGEAEFLRLVGENARSRRRWPEREATDAYRLYDREIAEVPWVVDRYGSSLHITAYPPGREGAEDPQVESRRLFNLGSTLGVDPARVFFKEKRKLESGEQHRIQARIGAKEIVRESGLRFLVNLSDYVDTGLFIDHRETRKWVRAQRNGLRVLNLFSYTGAFTVAAAAGGALSTTSVDTSQTYLDWSAENLRLNSLAADVHRRVRKDVMEFLREHPQVPSYELAIVDPPTRSNRHGSELTWDVGRDHVELLRRLKPLISPRGVVIFSTNYRRFELDRSALEGWSIEEITPASIPSDIGDRRVHRAFMLVRDRSVGGGNSSAKRR